MKTITNHRKRNTILFIKCGWCGKDMGQKDGKGVSGISHSICTECYDKELAKITEVR